MVNSIASLLGILGADFVAPATLAEFSPYFFMVLLAFCVVAGILQLLRWVTMSITKGGRNL